MIESVPDKLIIIEARWCKCPFWKLKQIPSKPLKSGNANRTWNPLSACDEQDGDQQQHAGDSVVQLVHLDAGDDDDVDDEEV